MFLADFEPLLFAERKLLDQVLTGGTCRIDGSRPASASPTNEIRGEFIRFLALGGDSHAPVHESGVRLRGAYINGGIELDGADKIRPLWLQECTISSLFSFFDARTKVISLDGSSVLAMRGDRAKIDGSLLLRRGFLCEGSLRLSGAEIDGSLACEGGTIKGSPRGAQLLAIDLATASIHGNVEFCNGFSATGLIWLDDALIGGLFDCTNARLNAGIIPEKPRDTQPWERGVRALKCHRLDLSGSLYLRGCTCLGEISFTGAEIGGDLDCRRGYFEAARDGEGTALRFTRVEVGGNVYLSGGFAAFGKVQLNGARVGANIDCQGGIFTIPDNSASTDFAAPGEIVSEDALSLVNTEVRGALIFAPTTENGGPSATFNGSLDLKSATVPVLVDDEASWPRKALKRKRGELRDVIHLDGFTYERLAGRAPTDADIRKQWLKCQPSTHLGEDFKPQPFEQLIKVLRTMGHPEQARRLAVERQGYFVRRRLAHWNKGMRGAFRALGGLLWMLTVGFLIGHGYRPLRVLLIMALVGITCGFYFNLAAEQGAFAPRDPQLFLAPGFEKCRPVNGGNWRFCGDLDPSRGVGLNFAEYPPFNPWLYSLDALLPVFDLKQQASWGPILQKVTIRLPRTRALELPSGATRLVVTLETLFGWLGSLLAVAAFSGLVKTD